MSAAISTACSTGTAAPGPSGRAFRCPFLPAAATGPITNGPRRPIAEAVALYRQQVLVAFGDVEDSLAGIRHLADQAAAQQRAVANARRAADLASDRYRSGIVSYIEVVDANREALTAERANAQLAGQRLIASVQLIKALGGGWKATALPPSPAIARATQPVR